MSTVFSAPAAAPTVATAVYHQVHAPLSGSTPAEALVEAVRHISRDNPRGIHLTAEESAALRDELRRLYRAAGEWAATGARVNAGSGASANAGSGAGVEATGKVSNNAQAGQVGASPEQRAWNGQSRRGRPPGAKNKGKATGDGANGAAHRMEVL